MVRIKYKMLIFLFVVMVLLITNTACVTENTAKDWFEKGCRALDAKEYDVAIESFNKAIELEPQRAASYYNRGDSFAQLGKITDAIDSFKMFLKYANPGDPHIEKCKEKIRQLGGTLDQ